MKKILTVLLFLSIGTLALMGCSLIFGTTYSVSTDTGYCYEVTTSEPSVIILMELAEAVEEPCNTDSAVASCKYTDSEYDQEFANYYTAEYLTITPDFEATLKANCAADDGTWKTY